jgi:hypothetical protein
MPKRKLTESLKSKIKKDYARLRQADYEGDALRYLKQVRGAHKGHRTQKKNREADKQKIKEKIQPTSKITKGRPIKVGGKTYQPGDKVYEIIVLSAQNKNQSVKDFLKENNSALEKLIKDYLVFAKTEIDTFRKIINEIPDDAKIYSPIKTKVISARTASFNLHMLNKTLMEVCQIYPVIFIEYAIDLDSNVHFNCPRPGEYKDFEDCGELKEYLEDLYPKITFIEHDNP